MADLDDRGQIILVAAFALGVIFIALAVVVNAAIYTENLATRREAASGGDALNYRHEIEQNVGHVLEKINTEYSDTFTGPLDDWAADNVTDISLQGGRQKARVGRVVRVEYVPGTIAYGTRFANASGSYESDDGRAAWQLASSVTGTRALTLNVSDVSTLSSTTDSAVTLSAHDSDEYWNLTVHRSGPDEVTVTVNNSNDAVASCTRSVDGSVTISVTDGRVAGEPCHALTRSDGDVMWFAAGVPSGYDISFDNARSIDGGYRGVVRGSLTGFFPVTSTSSSNAAIYSLDVRYAYHTPSLDYETDVRVAPEEPEP